jgi:hypothetical protein
MEEEEIRNELMKAVDGPNDWQSLRHLMLKLKKQNSDTVLDALLSIFFLSNSFRYQVAAGGILWKLKPKYKRNLREDIKRTLQNWNVSVEELPWYFAEMNGIETVRDEVKSILEESLEEIAKRRAETYLYWLSAKNREEFRTELNQLWNGRLRG